MKFNRKLAKQERTFVISDKAVYNVYKGVFGISIKRRISYNEMAGITVSEKGTEFVIHVPTEYDYRYA